MAGKRPYFEFELEGEQKTIEADTWKMDGNVIIFAKRVMEASGVREEEVARFSGVDYKTINRVIP